MVSAEIFLLDVARTISATKHNEERPSKGAIAQLGERLPCTQEAGGSIPPGSTNLIQVKAFSI